MLGRNHTIWFAALWVVFAAAIAAFPPETDDTGLTSEQVQLNVESFDVVWNTIRDKHWEPEMGGLDWDAVRDELRPAVKQARTVTEAREPIEEMLGRLDLSHYGLIPAEVYEELALDDGQGARDGSVGIDLRVIEGLALVTAVEDDSPAGRAGVRPGWAIRQVDDEAIDPVLATVRQRFAGTRYEDLALAGAVKNRLIGPVGRELQVTFLNGHGRTVEIDLELTAARGKKIQVGFLPPIHVWIDYRTVEDSIGYIAFNMFIDPARVMGVFNEAMESFMNSDGIVIDLRGNPGGAPMMAMGMAGWLIEEKNRRLGTLYTRDTELKVIVFPRPAVYSGPVAVLVDGLSGSCSEFLSGGLQDLGRARIFGSQTIGAVLPSVIEKLPNGDGFQYAFANYVSQGGDVLEGVGVIPDEGVVPSREELLAGKDPALDAAVAWIRTQR